MTQTVLIVGAGPGIGQAVATRYGKEGWRVVLASRSAERLEALAAALAESVPGVQVATATVDAVDPASIKQVVAGAGTAAAPLGTVIYNAAHLQGDQLVNLSDDEVDTDIAVNLGGGLHTIRAARAAFGDQGGTMIVTGGGLATNPSGDYVMIGMGKAALRHVTEGMHPVMAAEGIHLGIVTVNDYIPPGSESAAAVGDTFWALQTQPRADWGWEVSYPDRWMFGGTIGETEGLAEEAEPAAAAEVAAAAAAAAVAASSPIAPQFSTVTTTVTAASACGKTTTVTTTEACPAASN